MAAIDELRNVLKIQLECRLKFSDAKLSLAYQGNDDLILKRGVVFERAKRKPPIEPIPKACFQQAYKLATRKNSRWVYVEGYGSSPSSLGIPVLHAWVTPRDNPGLAYDLAWTDPDAVYIGIPFNADFVKATYRKRKLFSVLDTWFLNYPLLTGEIKLEDVMWKPPLL